MGYVDIRLDKEEAEELQSLLEGRTEETAVTLFHAIRIQLSRLWDKDRNQEARCICGHPYHRHFDSWDDMEPIGCKYCECYTFEEQDVVQ